MTIKQILALSDEQLSALSRPLLKRLFKVEALASRRHVIAQALNRKESK